MTAIANLPDLRPSLLLDFANSGRVDPRIQCTRASAATCFGPDGKLRTVAANVPRIDYDPATGKCLGLLVEEARTNQLIYSSTMDIGWRKGSAASFTTDPDDLLPGSKTLRALNLAGLIFSDTQSTLWAPAGAVTPGLTYTFSVYAKLLSGSPTSNLQLRVNEGGGGSGAKYSEDTPLLETRWTRVSTSITVGPGATVLTIGVGTRSVSGLLNCLLACPQVEVGAFPTSYIPTEASAVTRAADVPSVSKQQLSAFGTLLAKYGKSGWKHTSTPVSGSLNLSKHIDNSTQVNDKIERLTLYPRQLTAAQIARLEAA